MAKPALEKLPFDAFISKILRQLIKVDFCKKPPVILVNGVAEQYESWFFNIVPLGEHFTVHAPNFYLFDSDNYLHELSQISVNWVVRRLETYLDSFVQTPPYHLIGSSAGGQTAAAYASRYPQKVSKLVLICPSGLGGDENFPVIEGVSKRNLSSMIAAIFYDRKNFLIDEIVDVIKEKFENKKWRLGFVRMAQVTKKNSITNELLTLKCPVLLLCGEEDHIIPIWQAYQAVKAMRDNGNNVKMVVIPKCGHAPQIERSQQTNKIVTDFLLGKDFKSKSNERFLRLELSGFVPFDLDKALEKALAKKNNETLVEVVGAR